MCTEEVSVIADNVRRILAELPPGVRLVGAAKTRTPEEILQAVEAGLKIVGENYVQEAERAHRVVGSRVAWHMIGHLQSNKAKKAVQIFDMIETVDSMKLARAIDNACRASGTVMEILVEVNSGEERQKAGVLPQDTLPLIQEIRALQHIRVKGLMTMGPFAGDPEQARPYFRTTRALFDKAAALALPGVDMKYLSMGMSNTYKVALEEGANLVRIGTGIFGRRDAG